MSYRPRLILALSLLVLLSLTLSACNRDRPAPTTTNTTTTPAAARGTVAAPTPATRGADAITPEAGGAGASTVATPSAPSAQQVVVSPVAASGGAAGQSFAYTVVAGDTLATIAARFGTTPEAITQLNSLADPNALTLGQKLQIPGTAPAGQGASAGGAAAGGAAGSGGTGGAAAGGAASTYTVQQGDTLGAIAKRYGTTVQAIVAASGLANADSIKVGQKLTIPGGSGSGAAAAPATTSGQSRNYTVQRGDTLLSIARRFGLTVKQLQAANNISNPDRIYPGQTLIIP